MKTYKSDINYVICPNKFCDLFFKKENQLICEGNVIKPIEPAYFWSGSRVILKNKNEKFSEISKSKSNKVKKEKQEVKLSDEANKLFEIANTYITENRLRNVLSKMEKITDRHFGVVVGNFIKDTMTDF